MSSWIMRVAARTRESAIQACRRLLGSPYAWRRDLDRITSPEELIAAAVRARVEPEKVMRLCLWPLMLAGDRQRAGGCSKGILAVGIYHSQRRRFGLQFCPACLAGDEIPHFRQQWRLALMTVCPVHLWQLRDACFRCDAPIALHRAEHSICCCSHCGADQRAASQLPLEAEALHLDALWRPGRELRLGTDTLQYDAWLQLVRCLWRNARSDSFAAVLTSRFNLPRPRIPIVDTELELARSTARRYWLQCILSVLSKGLPAVTDACREACITKGRLVAFSWAPLSPGIAAVREGLRGSDRPRPPRRRILPLKISNAQALKEIGLGRAMMANVID